ncbi:hypothetical protein SSYRP_v1c07770 [Spiroplasma syrphidicola EA-1]|uniref:Uncharacterized protein n=1 Tax=Spiroplasma syrphidicola EA-1 TaxID=1276229 RepID=R4U4F9_9MOLU|nr:hypothetical protein [Spiroplasma syrphidicola]AGM26367.1 hypothetical protein SSYRP_v1c07770 [Spiroplasma syrphidicola EA-1]
MNKNDYSKKISNIKHESINTSGIYGNKGFTFQQIFLLYELLYLKDYNVHAFNELMDDVLFLFTNPKNKDEIYSVTVCQVKGKYTGEDNSQDLSKFSTDIKNLENRINLVKIIDSTINVSGKFVYSGKLYLKGYEINNGDLYSKILGYQQLSIDNIEKTSVYNKIVIQYFDHQNSEHLNIIRNFIKINDVYRIFNSEQIEEVVNQLIGIVESINDSIKLESKFLSDIDSRRSITYSNIIDAMKKFSSLNSYSIKITNYISYGVLDSFNFSKNIGYEVIKNLRKYEITFKWDNNTVYDKLATKINNFEILTEKDLYNYLVKIKEEENLEVDEIAWLFLEGKIMLEVNYEED